MAHRVFRLSISPERAPEVRRVLDFDGRSTLHDVHHAIQRELDLDDDHLYAFYLSGRYFDRSTEYGLSENSRHDSRRSLLFRLGLSAGQQLAYLFDFGDELRHTLTVVSIKDVEVPLKEPVLVESVGDAPPQYVHFQEEGDAETGGDFDLGAFEKGNFEEDEEEPYPLPERLIKVVPLAEAVLTLSERLDDLYEENEENEENDEESVEPPQAIVLLLRELSKAALELAGELHEDEEALQNLDDWSQERELLPRLLELPLALVGAGEIDSAFAVAHAFTFGAAEAFNGDIAIIFAESGKRDEAIAQIQANLKAFPDSWLAAMKSAEAYEALGDMGEAEASYRRAIVVAEDEEDEESAFDHLVGLLEDTGQFEKMDALMSPAIELAPRVEAKRSASVGRNEPCPCGSGKKYKKCHGA